MKVHPCLQMHPPPPSQWYDSLLSILYYFFIYRVMATGLVSELDVVFDHVLCTTYSTFLALQEIFKLFFLFSAEIELKASRVPSRHQTELGANALSSGLLSHLSICLLSIICNSFYLLAQPVLLCLCLSLQFLRQLLPSLTCEKCFSVSSDCHPCIS